MQPNMFNCLAVGAVTALGADPCVDEKMDDFHSFVRSRKVASAT